MSEKKLVNLIVESMIDSRLSLRDLIDDLRCELEWQVKDAKKNADDLAAEEIDFWREVEHDMRCLRPVVADHVGEIAAHLGAAVSQSLPSDDAIIMEHVRAALGHAKELQRANR